jgi:hypothetical protein
VLRETRAEEVLARAREATPLSFPSALPVTVLDDDQKTSSYGIPADMVPARLQQDMDSFHKWSSEAINLTRAVQYAHGVQSATVEGHLKAIRAYAGYLTLYGGVLLEDVSINHYQDPHLFAGFIAFLRARNVTRNPMVSHVSLARKVNSFINSGPASYTAAATAAAEAMDAWLKKLECQLQTAIPLKPKTDRPLAEVVLPWVVGLGQEALRAVDGEMRGLSATAVRDKLMTKRTALLVQKAIVASFVTGCHTPPIRLNLITTVQHPEFIEAGLKCQDKDCRAKDSCLGNRFVLKPYEEDADIAPDDGHGTPPPGYATTKVTCIIEHGKNEFRGSGSGLQYDLPRGEITKLLLWHINHGHKTLTLEQSKQTTELFVKRSGQAFQSCPEFTQYWGTLMTGSNIPYFPPSAGRTIFVEGYTSNNGADEGCWDGAALIMGNSVKRWKESYNPSRKRRLAELALGNQQGYVAKMFPPLNIT